MAKKPERTAEDQPFDFEKSLEELEKLVERMEQGDLTLEQSLKDFERGIELTRSCQKALQEAEEKVRVLMEKDGREQLGPLEDEQ
ncbi:MAG TPA: exodeoxyribonuclease VII small subunit [Gammaproteobacteria bacterium]|nr:exodeoxyribonuclease VII small subunit [Gammaproteobacteria bacterium]